MAWSCRLHAFRPPHIGQHARALIMSRDLPRSGHIACLEMLLRARADVDAPAADGGTAIIAACTMGHTECAELLIGAGCDVFKETEEGLTAGRAASNGNHRTCIELLRSAGVDLGGGSQPRVRCANAWNPTGGGTQPTRR